MNDDTPRLLLSIIIPTLDEEQHLPALLSDLNTQQDISLEIIVGDGGSTDATRSVSLAADAQFVTAGRGRGRQMNAAAQRATGSYLLFLHADSRLEDPLLLARAVEALMRADCGDCRIAGHFPLRFLRSTDQHAMAYRYAEEKTAFNRPNTTNGDQGLLLSADFFRELGGFDERMPFLEDQRIAEKIRAAGRWMTLPGSLKTSARRFEREGFHRRYILMSMIMGFHTVGVEEFFVRAPEVYQVQRDTGQLLLTPFFTLVWRMMCREWGIWKSMRIFYRLGNYTRRNSWQMFYFLDVWLRSLLGTGRYPCLRFHDRLFGPCTNFKLFDALTGLLCFVWFMGVLAPYFWCIEYLKLE
jgi:rSAM/selenodomain-associated transferase 2